MVVKNGVPPVSVRATASAVALSALPIVPVPVPVRALTAFSSSPAAVVFVLIIPPMPVFPLRCPAVRRLCFFVSLCAAFSNDLLLQLLGPLPTKPIHPI